MLPHNAIREWLGDVEPAWTLLDEASFASLRHPPSPDGPIRLAVDLTAEETQLSAVARTAMIVLRAAAFGPGLKMTAKGNLSRAVVAELCDLITWPDFDRAELSRYFKVVNEPDVTPLYFVRHVLEAGGLIRRRKGFFRTTPAARKLLGQPDVRALQAVLFDITFWFVDLDYFSRGIHGGWPQCDVGTILWSFSVAAHDWQPAGRLARLCAIPVIELFDRTLDTPSFAMEGRILRPLWWFGLLERKEGEREPDHYVTPRFYRKTALFDRFLSFDIQLTTPRGPRH